MNVKSGAFYAVIALCLLILPLFWYRYGIALEIEPLIDGKSFWLAAQIAIGEGLSPYMEVFEARADETPGGNAFPFVYPPPSLIVLAPLAPLDYGPAIHLIRLISHVALVLILLGLAVIAAPGDGTWRRPDIRALLVVTAILIVISQASRISLGHAQVNFVVLCGLVWFWAACLGRASPWIGAVGIVVTAVLKPYFAIFALYLFLPQGRRLCVPTLIISLVLLGVSAVVLPWSVWPDWINERLLRVSSKDLYLGHFPIFWERNFSLRVVIWDIYGAIFGAPDAPQDIAHLWNGVFAMMGLLQLGALWRARWTPELNTLMAAALLLFVFLISPVSWAHYMLYGAVACGLVIFGAGRIAPRWLAGLAGVVLIMTLQPSLFEAADPLLRHLPALGFAILWLALIGRALFAPAFRDDMQGSQTI